MLKEKSYFKKLSKFAKRNENNVILSYIERDKRDINFIFHLKIKTKKKKKERK